jgi:hypothetical protein
VSKFVRLRGAANAERDEPIYLVHHGSCIISISHNYMPCCRVSPHHAQPRAADVGAGDAGGQGALHAEAQAGDEDDEEEEEEEEEEAEESTAGSTASSGGSQARGASSAASEPANCAAWARQGLCDTGAHVDYMSQNCARTCETVDASGADAAADEPDAYRCTQWAMQGLCDEGSSHVTYMKLHCAEQCEMAAQRDPDAGKPPPADIWLWLIVGGFGYGAFYAVRRTIQTDGELSSVVAKKTLGKEKGVGPGKQNKAALHKQVRSAKKTS